MRTQKLTALEIAYRQKPEDEALMSELVAEVMNSQGYNTEEAAAYARLTQLLGRREQRHRKASEIMHTMNPDRRMILQQILAQVGELDAETAAFDVVPGAMAPVIANKDVIVNDKERRVHVKVGADWVLQRHEEIAGAEKEKPAKEKPARKPHS